MMSFGNYAARAVHDASQSAPRWVLALGAVLAISVLDATAAAQSSPLAVVQSSDGTLYLEQGTSAWLTVPDPISDADLAALMFSGELDGAIPTPFLSSPDQPGLQVVQDSNGTLYIVQAGNVWMLVPSVISDEDLASLNILGQVSGQITPPALGLPNPPAPAPAPVPPQPAPSASPPSKGTIKIASDLPRTGMAKPQSDSIVNGIIMALDESDSTAAGYTLAYQDMDNATPSAGDSDPAQEASNANRAMNDPDVMVYLGSPSGADLGAPAGTLETGFGLPAIVAIPIACPSNLGMISPANVYTGLTKLIPRVVKPSEPGIYYPHCTPNFTRVIPSEDVAAAAAARWAKDLGGSRAYVLTDGRYDSSVYQGPAGVFAATAPQIGLRVVGGPVTVDPYSIDLLGRDPVALAKAIRASGADVVFFGTDRVPAASGNPIEGKLWQQLHSALSGSARLMGTNGLLSQNFLDSAGSAAEGTYVVSASVPYNKLTGRGAEWYASYKARYGSEPGGYAIYGYEAMKVAVSAIERAGHKDRVAIRDAILSTRNFNGVLGQWSFSSAGDTTLTTVYGRQVKGGQFDDANAVLL